MELVLAVVPGAVVAGCIVVVMLGARALRTDAVEGLDVDDLVLLRPEPRSRADSRGFLDRLAAPLVPLARRLMTRGQEAWLHRTIQRAGQPDGATPDSVLTDIARWFVVVSPLLPVFVLTGVWWAVPLVPLAVVFLPLIRLSRAERARQQRIDVDLPDFLDVLTVTVMAGIAFRAALTRVAERFGGPLAEELTLSLQQIDNGASVREAFEDLARRNNSPALSQFVSAYLQSEEMGAPLAHTLTRIAADIRRASAQRQRREAARVEPRVTLVTTVIFVPAVMILLVVGFGLGSDLDLEGLFGGELS